MTTQTMIQAFCPGCNAVVPEDEVYCQSCGERISTVSEAERDAELRRYQSQKKPVVAIVFAVLLLGGLACVPMALTWFDTSNPNFATDYAIQQAREAFKKGDFDEAAGMLERTQLSKPLTPAQTELLYDIYFARAEKFKAEGNYVQASVDLMRIKETYSKPALVQQEMKQVADLHRAALRNAALKK